MRSAERGKYKSQQGFSLIEMIVTMAVLSIAAVGVLSVFTMGMEGSADPLLINQGTQLAQEKMDTIIGDRQEPGRGFDWIVPANYPAEPAPLPGFARAVTIFCVNAADLNTSIGLPGAGGCASGYTRVLVDVTHASLGTVSVATVVTDY
jgi:prepilin-type N-terminal cleavage/methylation domain-containing protein